MVGSLGEIRGSYDGFTISYDKCQKILPGARKIGAAGNPNFEIRNPKQILNSNVPNACHAIALKQKATAGLSV
jgi:hypothetical protein